MTITDAEFRTEAQNFLDQNAKRRVEETFEWGKGSDEVSVIEEKSNEKERVEVEAAKDWKTLEFDSGFGWISGPEEYGGRNLPESYGRSYREIAADYNFAPQSLFSIGLGMVAPTILAHAIPEVKDLYLKPLYRGEMIACQLFSEPIAGSDLAGIQTKAVRDGDEWVVSGQKVWTSGAHYSDIGEIVTRTSPDKPKHKGMTMFVVDMHAPGVEIRPLRQMTGGASFSEVFFDEVRIPDSHRLGDIDEGWGVALTTLMNERAAIGGGGAGIGTLDFTRFIEMVRHYGLDQDPIIRQRLANVFVHYQAARYTNLRAMAKIRRGQLPGPEMSIAKLALTSNMMLVADMLAEILGPRLIADSGEWGTYAWSNFVLGIPGMRIAGGTDEIMRNIVGERVLGLPKEPKPIEPSK